MEYSGIELKPITKVQAFEEPKEMLVWNNSNENTINANVVAIIKRRNVLHIVSDSGVYWENCAEIPQYDKSKFKTPHPKATYKEVLEASNMTDKEFRGFLNIGDNCSGLSGKYGVIEPLKQCLGADCSMCPIDQRNSKETVEKWMNGENIWKPKMRDMTREELLYLLWEKNKSECVVAKYSFGEYRPYITHKYSSAFLLDYTFATIDKNGKITEFEIPQVEEFKGDRY